MATLSFSYETGAVPISEIVDAFASYYNYRAILVNPITGEETPNPENKAQFARRKVKEHIIWIVREGHRRVYLSQADNVPSIGLE